MQKKDTMESLAFSDDSLNNEREEDDIDELYLDDTITEPNRDMDK